MVFFSALLAVRVMSYHMTHLTLTLPFTPTLLQPPTLIVTPLCNPPCDPPTLTFLFFYLAAIYDGSKMTTKGAIYVQNQ